MASRNKTRGTEGFLGILRRTSMSELKDICVKIQRRNIPASDSSGPIERSIEDPDSILPLIHYKKDAERSRRPLFDRDDIVVNQTGSYSSRNPNQPTSPSSYSGRSRSNSPKTSKSPKQRNNSQRRTNSPRGESSKKSPCYRLKSSYRTSRRSESQERRRSVARVRDWRNCSKERATDSQERKRDRSCEKKRSISPLKPGEYIPSHPDIKRRENRNNEIRYSRWSRSLSSDRFKASTSTRRYDSPRYHNSRSRRFSRSRSPRKPSVSPSRRQRTSRSPKTSSENKRQGDRRRSSSPRSRSLTKYSKRPSRSPTQQEKYQAQLDTRSKHSRSPHPSVLSYRPSRSRSRRPRSRSPNGRERRYREGRKGQKRSRSRSPRRRSRSRSPQRYIAKYEGIPPPDFGYFEGIPALEFWYRGPIRPGFSGMPRFYPQSYFPRSLPPGPIIPPRYPMVLQPSRPRIIYNNRIIRKPVVQPIETETVTGEPGEPIISVSNNQTLEAVDESNKDNTKGTEEDKSNSSEKERMKYDEKTIEGKTKV